MITIRDNIIKAADILKTYPDAFTQINSTLVDLVPSVSSDLITLFTLLFWTGTLALNTLPVLNDSISTYIHPSLAPYKVYIFTTVYGLLFGAAGTSIYNLLNALAGSAK
jgi:hypothetical protein